MLIKDLKAQLKKAEADWAVSNDLDEQVQLEDLGSKYGLGVRPTPPGVLTARAPRIRRPEGAPFYVWTPDRPSILRDTVNLLPKVWDWRNVRGKNWITPPHDQGSCGSCVAFATAGAVEAHRRIEAGDATVKIDLSEAALFFVNNRQCNLGDPNYGWWVPGALDWLMSDGACFEENYPYRGVNQVAKLVEGTELTLKITGYDSTTSRTQMKRWLYEHGPLITTFDVYTDFFAYWQSGASGVYHHVTGKVEGGHAVLVIGYDDNHSCWICKNSWAPQGAGNGFFCMRYGDSNIDSRMYLVQDVYNVYTRDEIAYNPRTLRIVDEGTRGWLLTDGASRMKMFANKEDARNGMRVARRYTRQGFVGRDNPRPDRRDYIVEYWAGNSGLAWEPLTKTDSIPYNPNNVVAEDLDAKGFRIRDGNHWMLLASDMNDALAVLGIVERYTRMCFIGRDNTLPNRKDYIMLYWE